MRFRDLFNIDRVDARSVVKAAAAGPVGGPARHGNIAPANTSVQREGVFVTPQSLVTFAGASTFITTAWKVSGVLVGGWDDDRRVALVIAAFVGVIIYLINETDPARGPVPVRERVIGIVIAVFNTIVLFSASVGVGEITDP